MKPSLKKYVVFLLVILVGVALDQWTKEIAASRLATQRAGSVDHPIILQVDEEDAGETVETFLSEEFTSNSPEEIDTIARYSTESMDGARLDPDSQVEPGEPIMVTNRKVVVIPGYWDYQYTENPGAAFGLLSDGHEDWRVPFFIIVSLLAVVMILYILKGVMWEQKLMIWGLSFIASGAIGNFIDRIRFGYVIDFIVWKYTDAHRWPTFNIADALICVGVGLMAIELIRDIFREHEDEQIGADAAEQS
jgi:signal peptidase II